jgi:peptidoglycan/xylan/chitin deacetylase (PgdA/CDA1 family)
MRAALRIDDIGASSKHYEVYSKRWYGLGNVLFLKYLKYFQAWGPYREMTPEEWDAVFEILERFDARLTVAVTACWVGSKGELIPFHRKFPQQAKKIREGLGEDLLEVANHGLTHCVSEGLRFKPRLFASNRKYHREFWDWIPEREHFEHMRLSQEILQDCFQCSVFTFVPPGNVYSRATLRACVENGIRVVNCNTEQGDFEGLRIVGNDRVIDFHDRELVLEGLEWLEQRLANMPDDTEYTFVRDL